MSARKSRLDTKSVLIFDTKARLADLWDDPRSALWLRVGTDVYTKYKPMTNDNVKHYGGLKLQLLKRMAFYIILQIFIMTLKYAHLVFQLLATTPHWSQYLDLLSHVEWERLILSI